MEWRAAAPARIALAVLLLAAVPVAGAETAQTVADLGREIFFDASLSASGHLACATCHDPAHAHAAPNGLAVQPGGETLDVPGFRAVPSLRYLNFTQAFFFDKEGTPTAGLDRDGRAATPMDQARRPFLAPHEMANADPADVVAKLAKAPYADAFRRVFGADIFANAENAFTATTFAVEQYEETSPDFHPYSSKFDLFLRGKATFSAQELRGFALFNRPDKGNCTGCHSSLRGPKGEPPLFTDYTYDNLGVPRNHDIPATVDPAYFDLGLCGPDRTDLVDRADLCGAFKVPTLRNVATRGVFFHNGKYRTLVEALRFYVRRDTNPEEFYPLRADGSVDKFDDLPPVYRANVNTSEVPYDRKPGQAPRLSEAEIADLAAFLGTLTDGYDPATNTADPARGQSRLVNE